MISTYSSPYFFSYTHVRTCSFAGTHMRMCFCFVLLSLALFYLSRVISCLLLRVLTYLAIIVTIFTFFSKHTHVRICTHADAHMRECIFFLPSTYSTYIGLCCFYFPAGSRFTHTHLRICICAATHMRMFPYIFPVIRERGLPHVVPVVFFFVLCTYFPPCCLGRTC